MSDTPRTDAEFMGVIHDEECVMASFARQLERESAELRKDAERWRVFYENCGAVIIGDTKNSTEFQVSAGVSFDHQSLLEAVDAAVKAKIKGIKEPA